MKRLQSFVVTAAALLFLALPALSANAAGPQPVVLKFAQAAPARVSINIYDVTGQLVRRVLDQDMTTGDHSVTWDGVADNGRTIGPGLYFTKIQVGSAVFQGRIAVAGGVMTTANSGARPVAIPEKRRQNIAAAGVLYVESNDPRPGMNAILAYRRSADGSLSPLPGTPFLTGGAGVGDPTQALGPLDSDQEIVVSDDHQMLFAVNSGSNTIAVFDIASDGSLASVAGSPFPSGGINPVSLGLAGDKLYVVNKNMDPGQEGAPGLPNYTGFRVRQSGELSPIPNSTATAPPGSSPTQALIAPNDRLMFGADFFAGDLRAFRIEPSGRLQEAPGSPQKLPSFVPPPALPLGLAAHPSLNLLYVGFVTADSIGVYRYDSTTGALTFLHVADDSGSAPCWIIVNQPGSAAYVVNTGDNSVSFYSLANPEMPLETQHLIMQGPGMPFQEALDPSARFLYVVSQRTTIDPTDLTGNVLHTLLVAPDGTITEAPFSPLALPVPYFARPQGIVVL
ncbi:MAG: FlgD immunoglobulin-like domain containing protein [Candidatus Eisenbacteria bacterium]